MECWRINVPESMGNRVWVTSPARDYTIIESETDNLAVGEKLTINIEVVEMSAEAYEKLPEFEGV